MNSLQLEYLKQALIEIEISLLKNGLSTNKEQLEGLYITYLLLKLDEQRLSQKIELN
jgi:hypothetical protein